MAASQSNALSATWNLDTTVSKTLSIGTEVIRACTSDHVQPLAIMACEGLGAKLAMCIETRLKMGQAAQRQSTSKVFEHIKLMIGFQTGDTAYYLAKSEGGVRFLGLATALLTAGTHFQAASVLSSILEHFASSGQSMPSVPHLKELLQALEPKLACTGFAESLATWSRYFLRPPENLAGPGTVSKTNWKPLGKHELGFNPRSGECPPAEEIARMIQALSEIHRVGEAAFAVFTIPLDYAAWVVTLVQWSTNSPPLLRTEQILSEDLLRLMQSLERTASKAMVQIIESDRKSVKIQVFKAMGRLEDMLWEHSSQPVSRSLLWNGLVPPKVYMEHRVREIEFDFKVKYVSGYMLILATEFVPHIGITNEPIMSHMMRPFPPDQQLVRLFRHLLPISSEDSEDKNEMAIISYWRNVPSAARNEAAKLLMELLAFSLIDNMYDDPHQFYISTKQKNVEFGYGNIVRDIIAFTSRSVIQQPCVSPWAFCRLASESITGSRTTTFDYNPALIEASGGQVIYSSLLEPSELSNSGPFRLRVCSGHLLYEGLRFSHAEGQNITVLGDYLNVEKVGASDYRQTAGENQRLGRSSSVWFCNADDGFLNIYYKPDVDREWSIWPQRFLESPKWFVPSSPCDEECRHDLGELATQISYCSEIAVALSSKCPTPFCVLENVSNRGKEYEMFIHAVIAEYITKTRVKGFSDIAIEGRAFVVIQGSGCLARACRKAKKVIQTSRNSTEPVPERVIIVQ